MAPTPPKPIVAYQGEPGAYSEDAVAALFGENVETLPCLDFRDAFEAVDTGRATHAVLPVENSIEGTVAPVNDLLLEHDLNVTGEVIVRIDHCLIGNPGARLEQIRLVYSHPQALGQCRRYLEGKRGWRAVPSYDTAGSVRMVRDNGRTDEAAIASRRSASIHGMSILDEGIQTERDNYTRFFVLEKGSGDVTGGDKTSIAFVAEHFPGSLHACLGEFARRQVNLTKLESRPKRGQPWHYVFFADLDGSLEETRIRESLDGLRTRASSVRVLGTCRQALLPAAEGAAQRARDDVARPGAPMSAADAVDTVRRSP